MGTNRVYFMRMRVINNNVDHVELILKESWDEIQRTILCPYLI